MRFLVDLLSLADARFLERAALVLPAFKSALPLRCLCVLVARSTAAEGVEPVSLDALLRTWFLLELLVFRSEETFVALLTSLGSSVCVVVCQSLVIKRVRVEREKKNFDESQENQLTAKKTA